MRTPRLVLAFGAAVLSGIVTAQVAPPPGGMGLIGAMMRADANHDGVVTREEVIASADQMFDRLDANHDGMVTPDEMAAGRGPMRFAGARPPAPPAGAGAPTPPPPPLAPRSFTRAQWRDRALAQFDRLDTNHDRKVDQAEMQAYRDTMRQRRQERRFGGDAPPPPPPPAPAGQ